MRFAIPISDGKLCMHFGHCEQFALVDASPGDAGSPTTRLVSAPPHEPGLLPRWLQGQGVDVVIAGGMGHRAQQLFAANGIRVVAGAPSMSAEALVAAYLDGSLQTGANPCDH